MALEGEKMDSKPEDNQTMSHNHSSSSLTDGGGDGNYSTAPSSPESRHTSRPDTPPNVATPLPPQSKDRCGSYDEALKNPDLIWDWHTGDSAIEEKGKLKISDRLGRDQSSPPLPKHIGLNSSVRRVSSDKSTGVMRNDTPEVINSSCTRVQVGFNPPSPAIDTTNLSSLPGMRPVITSPPIPTDRPHPQKLSKPRSIEEVDEQRRHYVPKDGKSHSLDLRRSPGFGESGAFCLDLSSFTGLKYHTPLMTHEGDDVTYVKEYDDLTQVEEGMRHVTEEGEDVTQEYLKVIDGEPKSSVELKSRSLSFDLKDVLHGNEEEHSETSSTNSSSVNEDLCADYLKIETCYDLVPESAKLVVFDTRLKVKKAFFALVANGVRSAPLWDSSQNKFVGMLTITDFIHILRTFYKSPIVGMDELEEQTIQTWRVSEQEVTSVKSSLIQIDPLQSLFMAAKMLVEHKIHRLPVIDNRNGNALYVLTHKRLLHHMYYNLLEEQQPPFMNKSLRELGIGTYDNIATATPDTPIITALNIFTARRVSALPIVDKSGRVVDVYAKFDVINLAAERTYNNLDVTLRDALKHRAEGFEGVHTCLPTDTLETIINRIVIKRVHRLIIVNDEHHVIGILSLSDLLKFLVLTTRNKNTVRRIK